LPDPLSNPLGPFEIVDPTRGICDELFLGSVDSLGVAGVQRRRQHLRLTHLCALRVERSDDGVVPLEQQCGKSSSWLAIVVLHEPAPCLEIPRVCSVGAPEDHGCGFDAGTLECPRRGRHDHRVEALRSAMGNLKDLLELLHPPVRRSVLVHRVADEQPGEATQG